MDKEDPNILTIARCTCSPYCGELQGKKIQLDCTGASRSIVLAIEEIAVHESKKNAALRSGSCDLYLFDDPERNAANQGIPKVVVVSLSCLLVCYPGTNEDFIDGRQKEEIPPVRKILEAIKSLLEAQPMENLKEWRRHMVHQWKFP